MQGLFDIGANLLDKRFRNDLPEVIARAQAANIDGMLVTGTSLAVSQQVIELCAHWPDYLYATVGVHPHDAKDVDDTTLSTLAQLATAPCVKAIGETGLDFNRNFSPREAQIHAFSQQIELAITLQKPLFLHERDATETQCALLRPYASRLCGAVVHCFTGDKNALHKYLDMGFYIGITGWICDERRGTELLSLVPDIPLERLLLETDAPYLTPRDLRPKPKKGRNEPAFLTHIAERVADAAGCPTAALIQQVRQNTQQLFKV